MQDQATQPAPTPPPTPGAVTFTPQQLASPRATYQALREKREVLGDQMSRLLNRRDNIAERLQSPTVNGTEKTALEQHMREITTRIVDMEKQLHAADAEVSAAAGVPGAIGTTQPSRGGDDRFSEEDAAGIFAGFAGISVAILAVAFARRMWRGTSSAVVQLPASFEARFSRMEDSIDAVAIEVERVSEGQRFLSKVYGEQNARALGGSEKVPEPVRRG